MRQVAEPLRALAALSGDSEPDAVPARVVRAAAELTGAEHAALAVLSDDGERIDRLLSHGRAPVHDPEPLLHALLDGRGPRPTPEAPLWAPVLVHGARSGALWLTGPPGASFSGTDEALVRVLATEAGLAIGNARLHEAVRQQARWLDGSLELSTSLLSAEPEDNALAVVAEQARRLAAASLGAVLEPGEDGELTVVAVCADDPGGLLGSTVPADSPAIRRVLAGEPVFRDRPTADPAPPLDLGRRYGPSMLLPLTSDEATLGVLALARAPQAPPYSVPERVNATQFAQQAALALLLIRARRDRELLAVLEDRDRIARDLHDLVIQRLFAVGLIMTGARRVTSSEDVGERIDQATAELDATVQEIRTAIFALQQHPEDAPTTLRTRVLREIGAAGQLLGFRPAVSFVGPVDTVVGEGEARNLLAALREGLSNAARHAEASRVEVTVDARAHQPDGADAVRLTVADDGVGMRSGSERRSGLRNLARRAESLGGSAGVGPGIGGAGTTLTWQVPR
ncbi:GAF domain-containing protein [Streptomyces sp. DSM 44915]|uniref:GAF domain-containing protein n=1 Tax=Streptomyces chisholmiae TaxID=3075540 RepID=A0ABU2JQY9_9ACTN|nr:GAF domain-containing protein [Streptomyces sp. DSM 44915]MDT0267144.1 GAF domain-containing protein [Streptomyces sp. DSM 44915]